MKLGIVSVQDAANCGAYLQGYALQKVLTDLGHDAGFVNRINTGRIKNQFYRLISRKLITHPVKYVKDLSFGIRKYLAYREAWEHLKYIDTDSADALVIGSDEIWNVEKNRYHDKKYFGDPDKKNIAYAPSCADCPFEVMDAMPHVKQALQSFHRILVRDENTRTNVGKLVGTPPLVVCDPTVLMDFDVTVSDKTAKALKEPYLLIYGYSRSQEEEIMLRAFAARHKLRIVSVNFNVKWADVILTCSPLEFPGIVARADYVVTSSFHCSIFALKHSRPLAVFPSGSKVTDMLRRYGAETCIATGCTFEAFSDVLVNPQYDAEKVLAAMDEDRQRSLSLLREALENQKHI